MPLRAGKIHSLALAELERRVQLALGLVPAGREHDHIAARRNAAGGDHEFVGRRVVVGEPVARQIDGVVRRVVQLDVVGIFAEGILQRGAVLDHDLADDDLAALLAALAEEELVIRLGVGHAGRVLAGDRPAAVHFCIGLIAAERGDLDFVHDRAVFVQQGERFARAGERERRVADVGGVVLAAAGREHERALARAQRLAAEGVHVQPLRAAHDHIAVQIDGALADVLHLEPVGIRAVIVGDGGRVGGHDLAEAHAGDGGFRIRPARGDHKLPQRADGEYDRGGGEYQRHKGRARFFAHGV